MECHRGECKDEGILFFQGQSSNKRGWSNGGLVVIEVVVGMAVVVEPLYGSPRKE